MLTLRQILCGVIIFDSQDIISAYEKFNVGYQRHIEDGAIPLELDAQQFIGNSSQGKALTVSIVWSSDDHEAGRASIAKIEALGTVVLNTIQSKTRAEYVSEMVLQLPPVMYGTCRTISVRKWTTKTTEILSRGIQRMPSIVGTAFTLHELRGPSAAPNPDSVFAAREPHIMLEIISLVDKEENSKESEEWGISLRDEILQKDPENVLPGTYISVTPPGEVPLRKIYGPDANYQNLLDLKKKYDPQNVFSLAVPKLLES